MRESILRTLVPIVYALLIKAGLDRLGIEDALVQSLATLIVTGALYVGLRVLERVRSSSWGWLLGYPSAPAYAPHAGAFSSSAVPAGMIPGDQAVLHDLAYLALDAFEQDGRIERRDDDALLDLSARIGDAVWGSGYRPDDHAREQGKG